VPPTPLKTKPKSCTERTSGVPAPNLSMSGSWSEFALS
jgi:hypothetical protein